VLLIHILLCFITDFSFHFLTKLLYVAYTGAFSWASPRDFSFLHPYGIRHRQSLYYERLLLAYYTTTRPTITVVIVVVVKIQYEKYCIYFINKSNSMYVATKFSLIFKH